MTISVRKVAVVAVLGAALVGCGGGQGAPGAAHGPARSDAPAPAAPSGPAASSPSASAAASASPSKAPTIAPGPGGLTPVFERARQTTDKTVALTFDADMTSDQGRARRAASTSTTRS